MHRLSRKERDKSIRRSDITEAAARVFARKGYYETTMLDIAKEAQYAVGTIYLYFKNKQVLYLTLIEDKIENLFATIKERVAETDSSIKKLKTLIETHLDYIEKNLDFFRVCFSEKEAFKCAVRDNISKRIFDNYAAYIQYIAGLVKKAQNDKLIRTELEPLKVARVLAGIIQSMVMPSLVMKTNEPFREEANLVLQVFLKGVMVERNIKI